MEFMLLKVRLDRVYRKQLREGKREKGYEDVKRKGVKKIKGRKETETQRQKYRQKDTTPKPNAILKHDQSLKEHQPIF